MDRRIRELIRTLEREAEARAESILETARRDAAHVVEEAERELERRVASRVEARERELRGEAAARRAESRRQAEARALAAREERLAAVFERAAGRLAELPAAPRYAPAARALVESALSFLPAGGARIVCDPATARAVAAVAERLGARLDTPPDAALGILARAADDSVSVDATLAGLLARLRPTLAMELAARVEDGA